MKQANAINSKLLVLDIFQDGLKIKLLEQSDSEPAHFPALLIATNPPADTTQVRLCGNAAICFNVLINAVKSAVNNPPKNNLPLEHFAVLLGHSADPFQPFETNFMPSLKILEMLAKHDFESVSVQTRSPLALLAAPVLKSIPNLELTMAIETTSDAFSKQLFPENSLPSERLAAAQAFKDLGISCTLQVSPQVHRAASKKYYAKFATTLARENLPLRLLPPSALTPGRKNQPAIPLQENAHLALEQHLARFGGMVLSDNDNGLKQARAR